MARSKSGGTRSFIRGRVGADVYTIGKDGAGKKQQVIRSLAEQVANPRTLAQMRNRMIMSTVMQAQSALASIIDHSFDGISPGQPSISHFIKENFRMLSSNDKFYNEYREKGVVVNPYIISSGNVIAPSTVVIGKCLKPGSTNFNLWGAIEINIDKASATMADLRAALNFDSLEDYITAVFLFSGYEDWDSSDNPYWVKQPESATVLIRAKLTNQLSDDTVLTAANIEQAFQVETNWKGLLVEIVEGDNDTTVYVSVNTKYTDSVGTVRSMIYPSRGPIFSKKTSEGYEHSTCTLYFVLDDPYTNYTDALDTYPIGETKFLNGGEI